MTGDRRKQIGGGALVIGGAVLAWWLLHGADGLGFGRAHGGHDGEGETEIKLRVSEAGIEADGELVSMEDAVARAHAARNAIVVATGAARTGTVADLMRALLAAGVTVHATSDVWDTVEVGHG